MNRPVNIRYGLNGWPCCKLTLRVVLPECSADTGFTSLEKQKGRRWLRRPLVSRIYLLRLAQLNAELKRCGATTRRANAEIGASSVFLPTNGTRRESKRVPNSCHGFAKRGVLAYLARRRTRKLRAINAGRGTDSVPGHQT